MSPTPCSRAATRAPGAPRTASTFCMCISKKSMIGHREVCSTSRTSSVAAVVNASGVTGPSIAASRTATTLRASSAVAMNGMSRRSNRRSGNWISSALPIVSALIPVLSDRKNTGTGGSSICPTSRTVVTPAALVAGGPRLDRARWECHRRSAHGYHLARVGEAGGQVRLGSVVRSASSSADGPHRGTGVSGPVYG